MTALMMAAVVAPSTALAQNYTIEGNQTVNVMHRTWTIVDDLFVGGLSGDGTLIIGEGGVVEDKRGRIGYKSESFGMVKIQGEDARWTNAEVLTIGELGDGMLVLLDNGRATAPKLLMGTAISGSGRLIIGADADQAAVAPGILGVDRVETGGGDALIILNHTDTSGDYAFTPDITGNVKLAHYHGTTRLTGKNSYTGGTVFDGGTLVLGSDNALGAGPLVVTGAGQEGKPTLRSGKSASKVSNNIVFNRPFSLPYAAYLLVDGANDLELAGQLSGSGTLSKTSSGKLTLSGDNSAFSGNVALHSGTLRVAHSDALGAGPLDIYGGTLDYANGIDLSMTAYLSPGENVRLYVEDGALATQSGYIVSSPSNVLRKTGSGTLRLSGNNVSHQSATIVEEGTLLVDGSIAQSELLTVNSGATLSGSGTVGDTIVTHGGILSPGGSAIGMLTVDGDLALVSGSILDYQLGAPGTEGAPAAGSSDRIEVKGDLTLNGTLNLAQSGNANDGVAGLGYYRLMTYDGDLHDDNLVIGDTPNINAGYDIQAGQNRVDLFIGTAGDNGFQHWQGGDGVWDSTNIQWLNKHGDAPVAWAGNHAAFKNQPGNFNGGTVEVEGTQRFAGLQFVDEGYRLQGSGSLETIAGDYSEIRVLADRAEIATQITGTGGITKTEAGTLLLSGNNTYAGGTRLAGGALSVSSDANLGHANGSLAFEGGVLQVTGSSFNDTERQIVWGARGGGFDITHVNNNFLINQDIVGDGDLLKLGEGALRLSGNNAYGNTLVEDGSLFGDTDSISGDIGNAGTVTFDQATDGLFTGDIGGLNGTDGIMIKKGVGTLSLDGLSSLDWNITEGGLATEATQFSGDVILLGSNTEFTFRDAGNAVYDGMISGNGNFSFDGSGAVLLTKDSSGFSGRTTIRTGTLQVGNTDGKGSLGGSLDVLAGATLSGSGTVGSGAGSQVTIASGGTLNPGNAIGTLTIDGDLTFEPNSRFQVEVNPQGTDSDQVAVTGNTLLQGGSVAHVGAHGNYDLHSTYTILTASGALSGAFDEVSSDFAFLTPYLTYDYSGGTIDLELSRNDHDFASAALTRNQTATAQGIESIGLVAGHAVYDAIAQLPNNEKRIRDSFDTLSGEIYASSKTALIEDSRFIRNAANDRVRTAFSTPGASSTLVRTYGSEQSLAQISTNHNGPIVWSQAFGSWSKTDSDSNAASLDYNTGGVLVGADRLVSDWRVGLLVGYSHSNFKAKDRASSGKSDNYHFGMYGGTQWEALGLRTGLAYSWHKLDTHRSIALPNLGNNPQTSYHASTFQAFGELGYTIDASAIHLEPFVNLAHIHLYTGGYKEHGGATALSSTSRNTEVTFSTLGLRAEHTLSLGSTEATVRATIGWRHAFGDMTPTARHRFSAGDAFTVTGVPAAKDNAVFEAGIDLHWTPNATFGFSYAGQRTGSAQDHGMKANLAIKF